MPKSFLNNHLIKMRARRGMRGAGNGIVGNNSIMILVAGIKRHTFRNTGINLTTNEALVILENMIDSLIQAGFNRNQAIQHLLDTMPNDEEEKDEND